MKLSLSSAVFVHYLRNGTDPRTVYKAFRDTGFTCVDFGIEASSLAQPEEEGKYWRELFDSFGLTVSQTHAPTPNPFRTEEAFASTVDAAEKTLRFCKAAGFAHTVVHPGARDGNTREEFFENNVKFYRALIPAMEETGVGILIENIGHYMDPYFLWTGADLLEMIERVDHPLVSACWDIGHANHFEPMHGGDQYASIVTLGDKLTAIHAHDNVGFFPDPNPQKRVDLHTIPFASGYCSVNWDAILQGLIDVDFKGTFNFETIVPHPMRKRRPFMQNGKPVRKLEMVPLEVATSFNKALYDMGKFMLESYGLFEG